MDLKDFIKSTLTQIIQGIDEAHSEPIKSKAVVSPAGYYDNDGHYLAVDDRLPYAQEITFDVALTVREAKDNSGKADVAVAAMIGPNGAAVGERENTSVSRIKFVIPLLLPQNKTGQEAGSPSNSCNAKVA